MREEYNDVLIKVRDRRMRIKNYRSEINDFDFMEVVREEIPIEHQKPIHMYLITDNCKSLFCASRNESILYYYKHTVEEFYDESFTLN